MGIMATSDGKGVFGISSAETGMITQSISYDYNAEKTEVRDHTGDTVGVTYYDEKVEISISAKVADTSPFSGAVASALTLVNAMDDHLQGSISAGTVLIDSISLTKEAEDYNQIEIKATYYPAIPNA